MLRTPNTKTPDAATAAEDKLSRPVARFEVRYTQLLDANGQARWLPEFARDPKALVELYRALVLTRTFDARAVALQRTGQLGTYASSLGQEAAAVGLGHAMQRDDVLLPSYRETGAMLLRGVRMSEILLFWGGDERGMAYAGPREDFPISVPIATQAPHAVGVAYALKHRGEERAVVCALGDGATSKGDFYEALNAAGVWQLPLVFLITNNRWAISVPRERQSHAETLAQKAIAAGIEGEQVDGNDLYAVHHVLSRALEKARRGEGPHVVEALTYRRSDHTTADDARRYRSEAELEAQLKLDPLARLRKHMTDRLIWTDSDEQRVHSECRAEVEKAVEEYLSTPPRRPESMFDHLFETLPGRLAWQRELAKGGRHG